MFVAAGAEVLRHPVSVGRSFALLFRSRNPAILAKNILVFPKGLWLAKVARKWRADHIHAHWGLTTATMAMIASEATGIPWSLTLHRGDIAAANLLSLKTDKAACGTSRGPVSASRRDSAREDTQEESA